MTLDLDRITHPLRLARGSHQPGSGKGCAMNVISYINGDKRITDFPECSARPLAQIVQSLNDALAGSDGLLSPENSLIVLDLGWLTVGTSGVPREVVWRWLSELLVDPERGVVKYATEKGAVAIRRVAGLCVREAGGERVSATEWSAARAAAAAAAAAAYAAADAADADAAAAAAAYAAADAADADAAADAAAYAYAAAAADAAAYAAADAAAYAAADADADAYAAADAAAYAYAAAAAADAAAYAAAAADAADADARIDFTGWAIQRWRELAGLNQPDDINPAAVDDALDRIHA